MAFDEATRLIIEKAEATIKDAKEAAHTKGPKEDPLSTANLQRIADVLMEDFFVHKGEPTLGYWKGNWCHWTNGVWAMLKEKDLSTQIADFSIRSKDKGGLGMQNMPHFSRVEVIMFLRSRCLISDQQEFEEWLPAHSERTAEIDTEGTWVNCSKGLLRIADTDDPRFISRTPCYFTPVLIPRTPDLEPPKEWLKFLDQVLERDSERIAVLQEWFGYCCLPTTRFHKMLMLVGPGGNGKSVVLHVFEQMLGKNNCSNVELDDMNTKYGPFSTFGKAANICGDIATRYLKKPGRIKAFVGGDRFRFEEKFMTAFSALPTAKLIFSMNELPKTDDESDGFWRRMHPMPFNFKPDHVKSVYSNPKSPKWPFRVELDSIFTWALEGLYRLLDEEENANEGSNEDFFTQSRVINACAESWRLGNEGVRRYKAERLDYDRSADFSTPCDFISRDYEKWALKNRERPFSAQGLGKRLHRIFPDLESKQKKTGQKVVRHWHGLRIHPEAPVLGD